MYKDVDVSSPHPYEVLHSTGDISSMLHAILATQAEKFALVTITLHFQHKRRRRSQRAMCVDQSIHYFLSNLRTLVRKTDVALLSGNTMYFVLLEANLQGGEIVQNRLWEALLWCIHNTNEGIIIRPCTITIGSSAYPVPQHDIHHCIAASGVAQQHFEIQPEKSIGKLAVKHHDEIELPALARRLGIPYLALLPRELPTKVQRLVSPQLAHELHCYPLGCAQNTLTVAMSDPNDRQALARLQQETGLHIFPVLTHPKELESVLEQLV